MIATISQVQLISLDSIYVYLMLLDGDFEYYGL